MKIKLSSILVDDQDKALDFYTKKLGFSRVRTFRWANTAGSR